MNVDHADAYPAGNWGGKATKDWSIQGSRAKDRIIQGSQGDTKTMGKETNAAQSSGLAHPGHWGKSDPGLEHLRKQFQTFRGQCCAFPGSRLRALTTGPSPTRTTVPHDRAPTARMPLLCVRIPQHPTPSLPPTNQAERRQSLKKVQLKIGAFLCPPLPPPPPQKWQKPCETIRQGGSQACSQTCSKRAHSSGPVC